MDGQYDKVVNVAQVKKRSPFRYPGGKTWLVPRIRKWLNSFDTKPTELIEPFAGGAIVGLTVAFEQLAGRVTLVELDVQVASVWDAIINEGNANWLARRIERFNLTPENVASLLSQECASTRERAFKTIVQNRVNRGGILAPGAGLIKSGENGRGLASRWYPQTLAQRIRDINLIRERLSFLSGDGLDVIERFQDRPDVVFFVDPPYTAGNGKRAGNRLYNHAELDHERLFALLAAVKGDVLFTYDNDAYVRDMADRHGFTYRLIPMKNTHHAQLTELLIGRNMDWLDRPEANTQYPL
jgi:DNA adenine methylase